MKTSTPERELIDRIVAWHNRPGLTSRIDGAHVTGIGIVALPFDGAAPHSARARVAAWLRRGRVAPPAAFDAPLIASLSKARIAAFAWDHGALQQSAPAGWPLRRVEPQPAEPPAPDLQWRFLRTAAIELGSQRIRVLVGADGAAPAVLGARFWSRSRLRRLIAAGAGALVLLAGIALAGWLLGPPTGATVQPELSADAPRVSSDAAPADVAVEAGKDSSQADVEDSPPSSAAPADAAHAAQAADTPAAPTSASPASAPAEPVWALATEPTRSRAGSQLRIMLMNVPTEPGAGRAHAEVMQTEAGWRAVLWPFATREAADRVRESLEQRGVRAELIAF